MSPLTSTLIIVLFYTNLNVMSKVVMLKTPSCANYSRIYFSNVSLVMNGSKATLDMDLIRPIHSGLRINLELNSRKSNAKTYQNFYQYSLDVCNMLGSRNNNILKRCFALFFKFGNFKPQCPVTPNHYYVRDYNMNDLAVPSFLFAGFYRVSFNMTQSKDQGRTKDFVIACVLEVEIK